MVSSITPVADGVAGIAQIVATLDEIKTHYGRLPAIRQAALSIIGVVGDHDQAAQVVALARFVRASLVYVADPMNAEYIQTPDILLLQILQGGRTPGDCDDHCVLFASLCEAVGIPAQIAGVVSPGGTTADHVIVIAHLDNGPLEFDLCAKGLVQPAYGAKLLP